MTNDRIIRAWKDPAYRASLSESERAQLPAHPAGNVEISDEDLEKVVAGRIRLGEGPPGTVVPPIRDTETCTLTCITEIVVCSIGACSMDGCNTALARCTTKPR